MKKLIYLCLFFVTLPTLAIASGQLKKSGHIWGYQFMENPSPEQFDKLDSNDKISLLSTLYSCFPIDKMECPGPKKITDELKKYEASFAHALKSMSPEELKRVNQLLLDSASRINSEGSNKTVILNGKTYTNPAEAIEHLWKAVYGNDPWTTHEFLCEEFVYFIKYPYNPKSDAWDKTMSMNRLRSWENRIQYFKGQVPDSCVVEMKDGSQISFSMADVIHRYREAHRQSTPLTTAQLIKPSPSTITWASYCDRQRVTEIVNEFGDYQNAHPSLKSFMILEGANKCQLTLSLKKTNSKWRVRDHLNPPPDLKKEWMEFATRDGLIGIIMSKQLEKPKVQPARVLTNKPMQQPQTRPPNGEPEGGVIFSPFAR